MVLQRRGGIVFLGDGQRDMVGLTPLEAEWLSQELRLLVTSEFCVQLHLAAAEAERESLSNAAISHKDYPLKKGLNP